ncbi:2-oxoglutarate dehydrogenase E1 component [Candidatus Methylacidithermus pantelleriae]|uniref:oxoglutarate dehydrogenase (succinyl-transferring) n=1 Tax=Candidatus Methylacidithermus pantelleriae TaxID=2744239 RepID=A0A8J2BL83_9BACT|nr:2-oxoglutarate dehydrogenase E1 component [Candidatus Methylacidithermus pantelleriae]CAF0698628.1 2-oxoglutarate decarboxylase [Candidatus Methylacidithermus pantelleriae]
MDDEPSDGGTLSYSLENAVWLEEFYRRWKEDPESVDPSWRSFFQGFELGRTAGEDQQKSDREYLRKQAGVYDLIYAYRTLGHYVAKLDPLGFNRGYLPELNLEEFGLSEKDLDKVFDSGSLAGGGDRTLREILRILEETYCGTVAVEYMHMQAFGERQWIARHLEGRLWDESVDPKEKRRILWDLIAAEEFERFLHTHFVGQKRFSLEGGETLVAMLNAVIEASPGLGIQEIVMGMAHRGRLNVVANVLGVDYMILFEEFNENYLPEGVLGDGDIRYHLGYDVRKPTSGGQLVGIHLTPNPSHLEAVCPVTEGKARAWQRRLADLVERRSVLPLLIHGDAAFMGQGIVQETLNLSRLEGYRTGGTLHIIVNNQIGFTTPPQESRSTYHCTAVARMLGIPIFHVNGDDPVAAVYVTRLALLYRQTFSRDVVIDLFCYRRHGHSEGDEPTYTQPTLYAVMAEHPPVARLFEEKLLQDGVVAPEEVAQFRKRFQEKLGKELAEAKRKQPRAELRPPLRCPELLEPVDTRVPLETLQRIGFAVTEVPAGWKFNPKILHLLSLRREMAEGRIPVDWAFAETLAFGSLLLEGIPVRLSGQDSRRGTFSQRHAVLYDTETGRPYVPLNNVSPEQATFCVYNSPLSEAGVLGFDFGYSLDYPEMLVLWEAQFGDFVNGAQVIVDQYIASSESKWGISSGIVLLLPHGYEGQGPEHSSARPERFLQLCAEDNLIVAQPTTPANFYHLLRRQALRKKPRKPLICLTPKSLLRDPRCTSPIEELAGDSFQEILPDPRVPSGAKTVIVCTGKVYYDLASFREKHGIGNEIALVRVEQLYPLHEEKVLGVFRRHSAKRIIWCQEEPRNMGAWTYMEGRLRRLLGQEILYVGREESASPATGSLGVHRLEQEDLVRRALSFSDE